MDIRKAVLSDCSEIAGLTEQLGYSGDAEKAKTILTGVLSQQATDWARSKGGGACVFGAMLFEPRATNFTKV